MTAWVPEKNSGLVPVVLPWHRVRLLEVPFSLLSSLRYTFLTGPKTERREEVEMKTFK